MSGERKPSVGTIPSDHLRTLLSLRDESSFFRQFLEDIIQIVVVLDASATQGELRWRLGSRTKPTARTSLHEAIESGAVIAVAPVFLKEEIEKYLPRIAGDTGVSIETAKAEWERVQPLIRFYAPKGDGAEFAVIDPKDSPYALTARELEADFVRTADAHFFRMGVTVIGPDFDEILRDYARSTSVFVTLKVGSGFVLTFSIMAFAETIKCIAEMIRKLPLAAKAILAAVIAVVPLNPTSREWLMRKGKILWERLQEAKPVLVSIGSEAFKHLPDAAETSKRTSEVIKSKLIRVRAKQTALSYVRLICLRSEEPLSTREIAERVLASGYHSRSKDFVVYVRRLLREDGRFVTNSDGLWTLRATA